MMYTKIWAIFLIIFFVLRDRCPGSAGTPPPVPCAWLLGYPVGTFRARLLLYCACPGTRARRGAGPSATSVSRGHARAHAHARTQRRRPVSSRLVSRAAPPGAVHIYVRGVHPPLCFTEGDSVLLCPVLLPLVRHLPRHLGRSEWGMDRRHGTTIRCVHTLPRAYRHTDMRLSLTTGQHNHRTIARHLGRSE